MDGVSRADAASDQDADRRRTGGRLRVPGLSVREGQTLPASQEPEEVQGHNPSEDEADIGQSLQAIIQSLNPTLRGWFEYFKHSYKTTFSALDGWIRMRLRSILRKRSGREDVVAAQIITAGPTRSLQSMGCTA